MVAEMASIRLKLSQLINTISLAIFICPLVRDAALGGMAHLLQIVDFGQGLTLLNLLLPHQVGLPSLLTFASRFHLQPKLHKVKILFHPILLANQPMFFKWTLIFPFCRRESIISNSVDYLLDNVRSEKNIFTMNLSLGVRCHIPVYQ